MAERVMICARCRRPANLQAKHGTFCEVYSAEWKLDTARKRLERAEDQAKLIPTIKRTILQLEQELSAMGSDGERLWKYVGEK